MESQIRKHRKLKVFFFFNNVNNSLKTGVVDLVMVWLDSVS